MMFGRGSVMQLYAAMMLSFGFFAAQMACQPMKIAQDNYLRASCELHIFVTTATALAAQVEVDETTSDHNFALGKILISSFVALVPVAFVLVVASKVRFVTKVLSKADLKVDEEDDQMLLRSFERFQIGLASKFTKFTQAILQLLVTIRVSLIDCS
jgi:hypothetical protein